MQLTFTIDTLEETCKQIWEAGKKFKTWVFYGDMGVGKTTFIHKLCETLGVTSTVSSPTYGIINEYESRVAGVIYHMDWYRIKSEQEAIEAGIEDSIYSGNYCFIEWPQKAETLLPEKIFKLTLSLIDFETRKIVTNA